MTSWKQGLSLGLILGCMIAVPGFGQPGPGDPCPPAGQCWTTGDVIDGHIDHHAQSVLIGMMIRGGEEAVEASSMLCAVKRRELEGIYIAETAAPISRAKSVGSNWWDMIPKGKYSACYRRPPEPPPMIVFRRSIQDQRPVLAAVLREAWLECGTMSVARCYLEPKERLPGSAPATPGPSTSEAMGLSDSETVGLWVNVFKQTEGGDSIPVDDASVSVASAAGSMMGRTGADGRVYFSPLIPADYHVFVAIVPDRQGCPADHGYDVALTTPDTDFTLNSHFFCVPLE